MADLYSFLASKPSSVAFTTMSTNTIRATTSATPPGDEALACPSCGFIAGAEIALLFCSLLHAPSVWLRRGGDLVCRAAVASSPPPWRRLVISLS
jgi:hypothetical protein